MEVIKKLGKIDAVTLANFILKEYGPMSHLKLQKLLYYCDAYHLAYFDEPIINEEFEAWVHGPVCRIVFDQLKDKSILYSDLSFDESSEPEKELEKVLTSSQMGLINEILKTISPWEDLELEAATHRESPWISARKNLGPADRCAHVISKEEMRLYYKAELKLEPSEPI